MYYIPTIMGKSDSNKKRKAGSDASVDTLSPSSASKQSNKQTTPAKKSPGKPTTGKTLVTSRILQHYAFFYKIINMIPRELYKPGEEEDATNSKYFKHKKMAMALDVKKSITKKKAS